jgi:hypothetical protein
MAADPNNTSTRRVAFTRSLAWIRQGRPGATDEWAYDELQRALFKAVYGVSEGVPIDKFYYPRAGRMIDLVVLLQNNYLTFANIRGRMSSVIYIGLNETGARPPLRQRQRLLLRQMPHWNPRKPWRTKSRHYLTNS